GFPTPPPLPGLHRQRFRHYPPRCIPWLSHRCYLRSHRSARLGTDRPPLSCHLEGKARRYLRRGSTAGAAMQTSKTSLAMNLDESLVLTYDFTESPFSEIQARARH